MVVRPRHVCGALVVGVSEGSLVSELPAIAKARPTGVQRVSVGLKGGLDEDEVNCWAG